MAAMRSASSPTKKPDFKEWSEGQIREFAHEKYGKIFSEDDSRLAMTTWLHLGQEKEGIVHPDERNSSPEIPLSSGSKIHQMATQSAITQEEGPTANGSNNPSAPMLCNEGPENYGDASQRLFRVMAPPESANSGRGFCSNEIRTSKYTPASFLIKNLWEQFHKVANIYFLVISILQFLPVSSVQPTTWFPLTLVLVTNMIKEAVEDIRRAQMDDEINSSGTSAFGLDTSSEENLVRTIAWKDVKVGSVIRLVDGDSVPADLIVIQTSDEKAGLCYIETKSLDGETNLKNRESIEYTHVGLYEQRSHPEQQVELLRDITVRSDLPNDQLNVFNGVLKSRQGVANVSNRQVIYRGCVVRNTKWLLGITVYTGMETKVMQNGMDKRIKFTTLDTLTNRYLLGVFAFLGVICMVGGILSMTWINEAEDRGYGYLPDLGVPAVELWLQMITFLILMSLLIPISLSVSMEIVKVGHAHLINQDSTMVYTHPVTGCCTPALARTSNLSEDLGRVQYVFSDKTGTLTQNVMEFMKCSVAGRRYGEGATEIGNAAARRKGLPETPIREYTPEEKERYGIEPGTTFYDEQISCGRWRQHEDRMELEKFFLQLAVCHTLMAKSTTGSDVDPDTLTPDTTVYQAASPDELALTIGAKGCGFWFKFRQHKWLTVHDRETKVETRYEVLNVCEFNSTRKRMSVVVRTPDDRILLMAKGADSVMYERLAPPNDEGDRALREKTRQHLDEFADEGLRTLVLAERVLTEQEYIPWNERFVTALNETEDRDEKLDAAAEEIENNLTLVGATAIEDKLQDGVPRCLETLSKAGIQVWVLTGDKVETAINIAMACNLLTTSMSLARAILADMEMLDPHDPGFALAEREANLKRNEDVRAMLSVDRNRELLDNPEGCGLIINGATLEYALQEEAACGPQPGMMLTLSEQCVAVVCCRVSPKQKAEVVQLVRKKKSVITLAIGDGANDVGMILQANIGIGISGEEGMQAVLASDYAVAQFRYLQQLLLIHGRWDCQRISIMILYFFYKNIAFAVVSFWYGFVSGFSGVKFWNDYYQSVWNVVFTAWPIMAVAFFNKDTKFQATLHAVPQAYQEVQSGSDFSRLRFFGWAFDGLWCSLVIFWVPLWATSSGPTRADGLEDGKWYLSFLVCCACHCISNLRLFLVARTWNAIVSVTLLLSLAAFFVFSAVFSQLPLGLSSDYYKMMGFALSNGRFWLTLFLTQALCLIPPLMNLAYSKLVNKSLTTLASEYEASLADGLKRGGGTVDEKSMEDEWRQVNKREEKGWGHGKRHRRTIAAKELINSVRPGFQELQAVA